MIFLRTIGILMGICLFGIQQKIIPSTHFNGLSVEDSSAYFTNPVGAGADPWVIKDNGFYYTCRGASSQANGGVIRVSKSASLEQINNLKAVWKTPKNSWNSNCVWAPELHHFGKRWYIYYAAGKSGPPYIHQRSGVLESVTDDPQGEYIDRGMLNTGTDLKDGSTIWAIDLTVGYINNQLYAVWSGWDENRKTDKTIQNLYIAKMSDPLTISSERVKISAPTEIWEKGGPLNLNEAPQFLVHNKQIFIIYSTRESWTPEYRLGQLKLKKGGDPLNPESWVKSGPVFQGNSGAIGVGHASFTTSPDGKQNWIFYHSKVDSLPGWKRNLRLQQFYWDKKGNPQFGEPVSTKMKIKRPSGEN